MVDIDDVLGVMLRKCKLHIKRKQESEARAVLATIVCIAVLYPPDKKIYDELFQLIKLVPNMFYEILPIEMYFSDEQRIQFEIWEEVAHRSKCMLRNMMDIELREPLFF